MWTGLFACLLLTFLLMRPITGAEAIGDWKAGWGQGVVEYSVGDVRQNGFLIDCDEGATLPNAEALTSVYIYINGRAPPPGSVVHLLFDKDEVNVVVGERGDVNTSCPSCSKALEQIWKKARTSKTLNVVFSDNRSANFSLKGAAQILPPEVCQTGVN
jgi:hypothetical protein